MTSSPRRTRRSSAVVAVAGAVAAALALAACGSSSSSSAVPGESAPAATDKVFAGAPVADAAKILPGTTMERIKKRGTLVVAQALDAPLLSQQDPAKPDDVQGFDANFAKLLAIYILGEPKVKIVPPATETREALLANGTVDVVFNTYTITAERDEQVDFAGPYFESGLAIAVKADNDSITGIGDLGGKTVIVGANTPAVTEVPKKQPSAKVLSFGTDPQAMQALVQGRGDAYVQDITLLAANAKANPAVKVVGAPFTAEPYGIGLKNGDAEMKKFVNDWLLEIQRSGHWVENWKATLGTVVKADPPKPPAIGSVPGS